MRPHRGTINWGIAATGRIAGQFARAFAELDDDSALVAVGSRRAETAAEFAAAHAIETAHPSYAALAADRGVDAVYVASLQPGHADDAVMFLEAGKHVLVEKPMALSVVQVDRMTAAAAANDRFLMEAMWMRFNPGPVQAVHRIHAGEIGAVVHLDIDFTISVDDDPDHRLRSLTKGGGALLDLGIYPLTLATWIMGVPTEWEASGTVDAGVDTQCTIDARFSAPGRADASARLSCGLNDSAPITATIIGTDRTLTLAAPFHAASSITIADPDGTLRESITTEPGSLHHQVAAVNRDLRAGERQCVDHPWSASRSVLAICDRVRAQLGVHYPVEI